MIVSGLTATSAAAAQTPLPIAALPIWLDVTAMALSGAFGAAVARNRHVPLVGVLLSGLLVAVVGGMIRDVLIGLEAASIQYWYYIPAVLVASFAGGTVADRILRPHVAFLTLQGIAIGLLIVIGTQKALAYQVPAPSAIFLGIVTACMGGALTDVFAGERAAIMRQAHWLLSAIVIAAVTFWVLTTFVNFWIATVITVAAVVTMRLVSVLRGWECPVFPGDRSPAANAS